MEWRRRRSRIRQAARSCDCSTGPLTLNHGLHASSVIRAVLHGFLSLSAWGKKSTGKKQQGIFRTLLLVLCCETVHICVRDSSVKSFFD